MSANSPVARGFGSDNHAGAHPDVLAALAGASSGHAPAYGGDPHTAALQDRVREHFGADAVAFPVFNGTGANLACIDAVTAGHEAVICTDVAHMNVDECGAPERIVGAKLLIAPTEHGKLAPDDLARWEARRGDQHFAQPRLVSITNATELGTVYTAAETRAIADAAHARGMRLHVDGARLANAAAALDASLAALTTEAGVDLLSFGATKNGAAFGDAVVFCRPDLADGFEFVRKQLGQLASKMRFISIQLDALLAGDLWLRNARHANAMAKRLADAIGALAGVEIAHPVEANAVFACLPHSAIDRLLAESAYERPFYVWNETASEVRLMCAWDTEPEEVDAFAEQLSRAIRGA